MFILNSRFLKKGENVLITPRGLEELFSLQVKRLLALDYPKFAGMSRIQFCRHFEPWFDALGKLEPMEIPEQHIPLVLVVPSEILDIKWQIFRMRYSEHRESFGPFGFTRLSKNDLQTVNELLTSKKPYVLLDVDEGLAPLGMDIDDWNFNSRFSAYSMLTADEGAALFTQNPMYQDGRCIAFLNSRVDGNRIPCLWRDRYIEFTGNLREQLPASIAAPACLRRVFLD